MAKRSHLDTIEDITGGCKERCILKLLAIWFWDDRTLEQMKCVGLYMEELEKRDNRKYEVPEIMKLWNKRYAAKFAEVYEAHKDDSKLEAEQIYNMIMGREEKKASKKK